MFWNDDEDARRRVEQDERNRQEALKRMREEHQRRQKASATQKRSAEEKKKRGEQRKESDQEMERLMQKFQKNRSAEGKALVSSNHALSAVFGSGESTWKSPFSSVQNPQGGGQSTPLPSPGSAHKPAAHTEQSAKEMVDKIMASFPPLNRPV